MEADIAPADVQFDCAELERDNVQYRNKIYHSVGCFGRRRHRKHCHICLHTVKLIYRIRIVGRRQATVRFMA